MANISALLGQILKAVYGKDVRQSIHDAISQCYDDVTSGKTLADKAAANANTAAQQAKTSADDAIANCNSASTAANNAASNASAKATAANNAAITANDAAAALPGQLQSTLDSLGLSVQNGKLCVRVERS